MTTTPTPVVENPTDGPGPAAGAVSGPAAGGGETADVRELTYAEAVRETLGDAMDERRAGVPDRRGHRRLRRRVRRHRPACSSGSAASGCATPRSRRSRIVGAAVGAALCGMRPIVELQFSDFVTCAMDQIVNQAAKIHFMLGGAAQVPMVIRAPAGSGTGAAAQHSQSLEAWFAHVPGLKVVMPATAGRRQGPAARRGRRPEPGPRAGAQAALQAEGPGAPRATTCRWARPTCAAAASDLTIVATAVMVGKALAAAEELAAEGIDVTVVDPRTITPLDEATILAEVAATGKALLVQEAPRTRRVRRRDRRADRRVRHLPHAQGTARPALRPGRAHGVRP